MTPLGFSSVPLQMTDVKVVATARLMQWRGHSASEGKCFNKYAITEVSSHHCAMVFHQKPTIFCPRYLVAHYRYAIHNIVTSAPLISPSWSSQPRLEAK